MVKYPTELDTDADIPRVDDNITEIGGEVINDLREAVFAIEEALGIRPQGSSTDLAERLDRSLDSTGNIKASALSTAGIITSPITDGDVDNNAGIEESKLDLDYTTVQLKTWIDALMVLVTELQNKVAQDIANLTAHTAHPATYGRHRAEDVDAYGGVFDGYNVQEVVDNLDTRLVDHVTGASNVHPASAISVDAGALTYITADDVQEAIDQLEDLQLRAVIRHQDRQHGNGVLSAQDVNVPGTRHSTILVEARATASGSAGDTYIRFALAPSAQAFSSVARNDRIDLTVSGQTYSFRVLSTSAPLTINIYGTVPVDGAGTAVVYRDEAETEAPSSLAVALRNTDLSNRASTLQLVHPDAAFILSNGFNGGDISATNRYLRIRYTEGDTGDFDLHTAMTSLSSVASTWTAENVARVLNEELFAPASGSSQHHAVIAFTYLGELGIAYDRPGSDGYVEIATPSSGNGAASVLGLTEGDIAHGLESRSFYIEGYEASGILKLADAYGIITAADTITVPNVDLEAAGVRDGMVVRVTGFEEGSYVVKTVDEHTLTFDTFFEHDFSSAINKGVYVLIYADAFSIAAAPADRTLYELCVATADSYGEKAGQFLAAPRASYADFGGFSAANLDLIAVSREFGETSRRVFWDNSARTLQLGIASGTGIVAPGSRVELPADARGTNVRLYDGYGADYLEFSVPQTMPIIDGYMDVDIYPRISEEHFVQVGTVLHNKVDFKHLDDRREFGTVGRQDVRDDFKRDYISYPRSLLRGNGIIRGLSVSGLGTTTLSVDGGEVLVDGQIKSIRGKSIDIPADGGNVNYNLFMDADGILRLWQDDFFSADVLATPSTQEILTSQDKTMIAKLYVNGSNVISTLYDMRRFVGRLDDRIDLMVEENDITHGSFASLNAAVNYMNALDSGIPTSRKIRVKGRVVVDQAVYLPTYCALEGDTIGDNDIGARLEFIGNGTIVLNGGHVIRNLTFFRTTAFGDGMLGNIGGGSIVDTRIENCTFQYSSLAANNNAIGGDEFTNSVISGCLFINVDSGIFLAAGDRSVIRDCFFNGVRTEAVYIEAPNDVVIADNFITSSSHSGSATTGMINLYAPVRTVVRKNYIVTTSTDTAAGNAILIQYSSNYCIVEDNTLLNSGSTTGFQNGIVFDGTGPLTDGDHFLDIVSQNMIKDFSGGTATGLSLTSCNGTLVFGNRIWSCRAPFVASQSKWLNVVHNSFGTVDNATIVSISGSGTQSIILGYNDIISANILVSTALVSVSNPGPVPGGTIIGNNIYITLGAISKAHLNVDGPEWVITQNNIGTNGAAVSTADSPLTLTSNATNCIVEHNNFIHALLFGAPSRISDSGSRNIERLNKGISYSVSIPVTMPLYMGTDWGGNSSADGYGSIYLSANTSTIFQNDTYIVFSAADGIPVGASITSVSVRCRHDAASTLFLRWVKRGWDLGSTTKEFVSANITPTPTLADTTVNLTPLYGTEVMSEDDVHVVRCVIATANPAYVYGIQVNFTF